MKIDTKKAITYFCMLFLITACGTDMAVQKIAGKENEYVLNRDSKTPFANLPAVKESVKEDASNYCQSLGRVLFENYSIDKERAVFVWPETTMYFTCILPNPNPQK